MKDLLAFWPETKHVNSCITADADAKSSHEFLAVHSPIQLLRYYQNSSTASVSSQEEIATEEDILHRFQSPYLDQSKLYMVLIGDSGIGKSHMVKWLTIQLTSQKNDTYHIVTVPKSIGTMRQVLDEIIKGFENEFPDILADIDNAIDFNNHNELMQLLGTHISNVMQKPLPQPHFEGDESESEKAKVLRQRNTESGLCSAFRYFFDHPAIKHLLSQEGHLFHRIIERFTGKAEVGSEGHLCQPDDLPHSESDYWEDQLDDISDPELLEKLDFLDNKEQREVLSKVLNTYILDPALRQLLPQNGKNVLELFDSVRTKLHQQNKELVLLIEDFATLTGIQNVFVDAILKDVKDTLCPIRVCMAMTTNEFTQRDTLMTRVGGNVWEIKPSMGYDASHREDFLVQMVGQYLNAARHGQEKLEKAYIEGQQTGGLQDWVPVVGLEDVEDDATRHRLQMFGTVPFQHKEVPLFPFNRSAILQYARKVRNLETHQPLSIKPREIINFLLRELLMDPHRENFSESRFPTKLPKFERVDVSDILPSIREKVTDTEKQEQYLSLWLFWFQGYVRKKQPIPQELFEAFGLPPIAFRSPTMFEDGEIVEPPEVIDTTNDDATEIDDTKKRGTVPPPPTTPQYKLALNKWERDGRLSSQVANRLRKASHSVLKAQWDLEVAPYESFPLSSTLNREILIYNSEGQGTKKTEDKYRILLCSKSNYADKTLRSNARLFLESLYRTQLEESENPTLKDLSVVSVWAQRQVKFLRNNLLSGYEQSLEEVTPIHLASLLCSSAVLGFEQSSFVDRTKVSHLSMLWFQGSSPKATKNQDWDDLLRDAYALQHKDSVPHKWIADHFGIFQGGPGHSVKNYKGVQPELYPMFQGVYEQSAHEIDSWITESSDTQLRPSVTFLKKLQNKWELLKISLTELTVASQHVLPQEYNKDELQTQLQDLFSYLQTQGVLRVGSGLRFGRAQQFFDYAGEFRKVPLKETLELASELSEEPTLTYSVLVKLSRVKWKHIKPLYDFFVDWKTIVERTKEHLLQSSQLHDPLRDAFDRINSEWEAWESFSEFKESSKEEESSLLTELQDTTSSQKLYESASQDAEWWEHHRELLRQLSLQRQTQEQRKGWASTLTANVNRMEKQRHLLQTANNLVQVVQTKLVIEFEDGLHGLQEGLNDALHQVIEKTKHDFDSVQSLNIESPDTIQDQADLFTGPVWNNLFSSVKELTSYLESSAKEHWLTYTKNEYNSLPHQGENQLQSLERQRDSELRSAVRQYREHKQKMAVLKMKWPVNQQDMTEFCLGVEEYNHILQQIDLSQHQEVLHFLEETSKPQGASLATYTAIVQLWLKEQKSQSFRIILHTESTE